MEDVNTKKIESIFREANSAVIEPSPYLKTRVLARLREEKARSQVTRWKWVALFGSAFSMMLVAVVMLSLSESPFIANVGKPVLVKVEMENIRTEDVAFAEIILPEGVYFYSSQFPEMNDRRSLTLDWDSKFASGRLPFVIKSNRAGSGEVLVLLKDRNQIVTGQKKVLIRFKGEKS